MQNIEDLLYTNATASHPLRPFLAQQILDINNLIKRIRPKVNKRSLDFIGSAWKWIAGSPDKHDLDILNQKIDNILDNNNRQMVINELTVKRIQEISNVTNEILRIKREGWAEMLINKLDKELQIVEKELRNIEYAIQWAKSNIVNSFILSITEIEEINRILENYKIPNFSTDELLSFGKIKIATNNKEILYILSLPITSNENCKKYLLKPIKNNNVIDKIEFPNVIKCNDSIYGIKTKCNNFYDITICNNEQLIHLDDTFCAVNLLKNRVGNCTKTNNDHVPTIEEIESDLLLLNQYNGNVTINDEKLKVNGTFLIRHQNVRIELGNQKIFSTQVSGSKPLPAFLQPKDTREAAEEVLSLEGLKKFNIENIKKLESLEERETWTVGTILVLIIIGMAIWAIRKIWHKKPHKVTEELPETTEEMTEEITSRKTRSLHDIFPL